ncbi:YceI family protein [Dietzia sp. SLG310A2-38A2]|uniref:YceI family protein n=1 Tax=Dietzia sp. SLG310A2-38A2 TaxID=1630643 RepID=UPI0015FD0A92|nr:YceI family protein [Dietzia sp. SLG310A2-38A2]MBB1030299.1 YceI family protein [Dietzia sp. SLG310A2-38A2]
MRRLPWIIGALVVVIVVVVAAPYLYKAVRGGDDAPAAAVSTEDAEAPVGGLDGSWVVVPGSEPNETAAGYTVDEILRGEPVTVVGSTSQVTGEATISESTLDTAEFEVRIEGIATDIGQRDSRARSPEILDAQAHPSATLALAAPVDLTSTPSDGTTVTIPMEVDLTIKGTTVRKPVEVTVLRSGEELIASGAVPVTWTEVGVEPPSLGFVTVDPTGTIDFLVNLARQ